MKTEKLILNSLSFEYPKEPVICYFSKTDNERHSSTLIKSPTLIPKEVKGDKKFLDIYTGRGGTPQLYTTFDLPCENFEPIAIDFNDPENEYFVKRYYHHRLEIYFRRIENVVVTRSGVTRDLQIWIKTNDYQKITYHNNEFFLYVMDKFTVKVKYDTFNHKPYILVSSDRPSLLMDVTIERLESMSPSDPFELQPIITSSMINKVMTVEDKVKKEGKPYQVRNIEKLCYLQSKGKYYDPSHTFAILSGEMKKVLGLDIENTQRSFESKYVKYWDKITEFKNRYFNKESLNHIFINLASEFTLVNELQIGQIDSSKRTLIFGNGYKSTRPQDGINYGPAKGCLHKTVQLIAIYHEDDKTYASNLLGYFKNGNYQDKDESKRKPLRKYIGSAVEYANPTSLHIEFKNRKNPIPEIRARLHQDDYQNISSDVFYVGIYISPIHKYSNEKEARECYYQVKELFLKQGIVTQCVEIDKMKNMIQQDCGKTYKNFIYTLQNMAVAICAKAGGSPWLLDTTSKRELVIGIGAFKSDNEQYIGAAFSFDNTGVFNKYNYFQEDEVDELVGAIRKSILDFSRIHERPDKIIIHYYKLISKKNESQKIERMLSDLNLNVPVYVVTINKTESEDIVVFDRMSTYHDKYKGDIQSMMPFSGKWVNLGHTKNGHRYLLCNNTRYEGSNFNKMDGFPFPIKLTITCPNRNDNIDTVTINQLIEQVYQFSRIYWKSVKQQGLPVTIKYPEMIAEIMPHFTDKAIYPEQDCLWFL